MFAEGYCQSSYRSRGYYLGRWGQKRVSKDAVPSSWFKMHNTNRVFIDAVGRDHSQNPLIAAETGMRVPAEHTGKQKFWSWRQWAAVWPKECNTSSGNWHPLPGRNETLTLCHWPCWISGLKQGTAVLDMGLKACCANPCDKVVVSKLSYSWYKRILQMSMQVNCTVVGTKGLYRWVGYFSCMCIFGDQLETGEGNVAHSNRGITHDWIFRQSYVSGFWFYCLLLWKGDAVIICQYVYCS